MKKLFLTFGMVAAVALPIVAVVSCGSNVAGGVVWNSKNSTLAFNLDGVDQEGMPFTQYAPDGVITKDNFTQLDTDFDAAVNENNGTKLTNEQKITLKMTGQFKYPDVKPSGFIGVPIITVNYVFTVDYKYNSKSSISQYKNVELKSNILDAAINGLNKKVFAGESILKQTGIISLETLYEGSDFEILGGDGKTLLKNSILEDTAKAIWKRDKISYSNDILIRSVDFDAVTV